MGGTTAPLARLATAGNQLVTPDNKAVRLRSINWFGAEGTNFTPNGTWTRGYRSLIDQVAGWGFNCIRLPFSGDFTAPGRTVASGAINAASNPDLAGLSAIEVLDRIIDYCAARRIYVVLDHHRRTAGDGADGSPVDGSYTLSDWHRSWLVLAERYKDNPAVVGADVHNEPYALDWSTWAGYVEGCGQAIHAVAADWIIFCEGVGQYDGDSYWWGGQLEGVAARPVKLGRAGRLAYAPHEYGQSVGHQDWLAYDGQKPPANYPMNLYAIWKPVWGFIYEGNIAPIWVGEFGGRYGYDGSGAPTAPNGTYERQWTQELVKYLNGDLNGAGGSDLPPGKAGMSFAYWSLNPNSGDTGGLLQDDWQTPQSGKLALLSPLLADQASAGT